MERPSGDPAAPTPVVLTKRARHAVGPGFYGSTPDAPIIPVNLEDLNDAETRLAYYRRVIDRAEAAVAAGRPSRG
jgi:hypothetical protein